MLNLFKFLGLPTFVVTNNARCLTCDIFKRFSGRRDIQHILTSPYHLQSNGAAERAVEYFKTIHQQEWSWATGGASVLLSPQFHTSGNDIFSLARELLAFKAHTHTRTPRQGSIRFNNSHQATRRALGRRNVWCWRMTTVYRGHLIDSFTPRREMCCVSACATIMKSIHMNPPTGKCT